MHVLMPFTASAGARDAAAAMEAAGHVVHRCHDDGDRGFPCTALRGRTCPIEKAPIDVVVDVRFVASRTPLAYEDGVVCALRRRIPLVVGGAVVGNPFRPWAAAEHFGVDVTRTAEAVAATPLDAHSAHATDRLQRTLAALGHEPGTAHVEVRRHDGGLHARVFPDPAFAVGRKALEAAAIRVLGAIREVDHWAAGVDVSIEPAAGEQAS